MRRPIQFPLWGATWLAICGLLIPPSWAQDVSSPPAADVAPALEGEPAALDVEASEDVEVLTSGPIHEGFADVVALDVEPTEVIAHEPPQPIDEVPPEEQPEGSNIVWLPGYWHWDVDREGYIWISGVYRDVPPNRRWVPGYYVEADGGWQRVSGFWAPIEEEELQYLPEPPQTLEVGPSSPAPSENHFWIPGNWVWQQSNYVWQPGYWAVTQPNWVWMPPRYVWTPSGCLFVRGYWDYPFVNRGLLFAPIWFNRPIYAHPGFFFRPRIWWNIGLFSPHWFVRPWDRHYYYGNFYGPRWGGFGFQPWFAFHGTRGFYDPLFLHQRWHWKHRPHDRRHLDFADHLRDRHRFHERNEFARPPRTFDEMNRRLRDPAQFREGRDQLQVAMPVDQLAGRRDAPVRVGRMGEEQRQQVLAQSRQFRDLQEQRRQVELEGRGRARIEGGPATVDAQGRQTVRAGRPVMPDGSPTRLRLPETADVVQQRRGPDGRTRFEGQRPGTGDPAAGRARGRGQLSGPTDQVPGRTRDAGPQLGDPRSRIAPEGATTVPERRPRPDVGRPATRDPAIERGPARGTPGPGGGTRPQLVDPRSRAPQGGTPAPQRGRSIERPQGVSPGGPQRGPQPQIQRGAPQRGAPQVAPGGPQRGAPQVQPGGPQRGGPQARPQPQIQRSAPQRGAPQVQPGGPQRGGPQARPQPQIQRSAPQRGAPQVQPGGPQRVVPRVSPGGGGGSPAMRGTPGGSFRPSSPAMRGPSGGRAAPSISPGGSGRPSSSMYRGGTSRPSPSMSRGAPSGRSMPSMGRGGGGGRPSPSMGRGGGGRSGGPAMGGGRGGRPSGGRGR